MVIDFSTANLKKMPPLVLRNLDGTAIQVLGCAQGLKAELTYNEVSSISFDVPRYVDGVETPGYDWIIGTRIVDMIGWGQFILSNPNTVNDGVNEIKSCSAYSLEYEFTKKKISLPQGTYCFWNPAAPDETVLGIILEYMPSWSVGNVDNELIGKYRTFDVSNANIYDFIKSTLQKSFSCIFTFDTYLRKIHVKHTNTDAEQSAVYLSLDNLAQELKITEDSDNLITVLDVNGADGVNIRNVNPLGTNKIYNLDYYMNLSHFSQEMIDKWAAWKAAVAANQGAYYNLSIERMLRISQIASEEAAIDEAKNVTLESLKQIQSVQIELLTSLGSKEFYIGFATYNSGTGLYEEPSGGGYARKKVTSWEVVDDDPVVENLVVNHSAVTFHSQTSRWFNLGNTVLWAVYVGEDSSTPIYTGTFGYWTYSVGDTPSIQARSMRINLDHLNISDTEEAEDVRTTFVTLDRLRRTNEDIAFVETNIAGMENSIAVLTADRDRIRDMLININESCSFDQFFTSEELLILDRYFIEDSIEEASFVLAPVNAYTGASKSKNISVATVTITSDNIESAQPQDIVYSRVKGGVIQVAMSGHPGTSIVANIIDLSAELNDAGHEYVVTAYLDSGEMDGAQFAGGTLTISGDSDVITVESGRIYINVDTGKLFFTENVSAYAQYSVEQELYDYGVDALSKLAYPSYTFDVSSANFFSMDDFAAFVQSVGLGKRIYLNDDHGNILRPILVSVSLDFDDPASLTLQFGSTYNLSDSSFQLVDLLEQSVSMGRNVDTGRFNYNAFIDSGAATSVKQFMDSAIDVAKNSIVSGSGQAITWDSSGIRCRKELAGGGYEPQELAIINNCIAFTDDAWSSAKLAIGKFVDPNFGEQWGIVAPSIVGTLLAGRNLLIESSKKDGGKSVFRVDGDGAVLHNASFDIVSGGNHIMLDPTVGIAIGEYPVIDGQGDIDSDHAKFWVDPQGNVHIKGIIQATDFQDQSGNSMLSSGDQIKADYLDLKGLTIHDNNNNTTFEVDSQGNVTIDGTLDGCDGTFKGSLTWTDGNNTASIAFSNGDAGGGAQTDLIKIDTNVGILIDAGTNIRIHAAASGTSGNNNGIWLQNTPSRIRVLEPGGGGRYVTLYAYIQGVIDGTYTS